MEKAIKPLENSLDGTDYLVTMLTKEDEQRLLFEYNDTAVEYPRNKTLITLFEEQAAINPDNIALVYKDTQLTYHQFNEKANQFARYLQSKGIKEEVLVPICIEKSLEMFIGILGILKAGGAYVPIDPEFPEDRKKYIFEDTGAALIVTSLASLVKVSKPAGPVDIIAVNGDWNDTNDFPADNLPNTVAPHNLAYIIYTSGSTGAPKGVMVEHKSIYNYLLTSKAQFISENKSNSGSYINFAFTFDASLKSIFTPLVSGKLIVISSKLSASVFEDPNLHKYAPYDFMQLTPAHLDFFYAELKNSVDKQLTYMLSIGGEALNAGHFDYLKDKGVSINIINEYGPTEATVACTGYRFNTLDADKLPKRLPIGKPIPNVQIYILNEDNQLVPPGEVGEICVGGIQVARGYLNQGELTKRKFIANVFNPTSDDSIYKTGDLGRWMPDGNIECLGRTDDQVKIRGYRIELGDIESTLINSDRVSKAAVVAIEDAEGKKELAAYVVPNGHFDKKELINFLQGKLPPYMVPDIWVEMDQLPLSHNGKVDRKALPEPKVTTEVADNYVPPRNEYEKQTAEIWQGVLNLKQISIYDNFFDLGGHSVLALKVLKQVEKLTGKNLPFSTLFEYPTIEKFAVQLKDDSKVDKHKSLIPLKVAGNKSPLYIVAGINGTAFAFMNFANGLDADQPVFVLQEPQKIDDLEEFPDSVEGIAKFYMDQILKQNPSGPYNLAGHCFGGIIAFEMSKQLEKQNKEVSLLFLLDAIAIETEDMKPGLRRFFYLLKGGVEEILIKSYKNVRLIWYDSKLALKYRKDALERLTIKIKKVFNPERHAEKYEFSDKVTELYKTAIRSYKITPYSKHVKLFRAKMGSIGGGERKFLNWKPYTESIELHEVNGDHLTMLDSKDFPPLIQKILDRVE